MALMLFRTHNMNGGPGHCQLARSLERILEEAQLSGELKLSNRKLKEFPRTATKYNLGDTVIADLSRNRFCELPEDITSYAFLETLLLYHNTIRSIPQSVKGLTSLTYLDLRSNHLISLPREICFLPLQVLLVAHNRLTSLPDELGRMEKLTDLDVSCNQIGNLPTRIGDLKNLRSLSLRSNQLIYLPREITFLSLISLDISNNRISGLPNEIRQMTTLVSLKLDNNPLTSPPASLCIRGLVHILKFLETQALNDKVKCGPTVDGFATLRRAPRNPPSTIDDKLRRHHVDSGYSTSDGLDKRWSQDNAGGVVKNGLFSSKTSPLEKVITDAEPTALASVKLEKEFANNAKDSEFVEQRIDMNNFNYTSNNNSENTSPDEEIPLEGPKLEGKSKSLCNIQTYREYKEALKQQRNQEIQNVYRTKSQPKVSNDSSNNVNKCSENLTSDTFVKMNGLNQDVSSYKHDLECNFALPLKNGNTYEDSLNQLKKPIQKVPPSRNLKKSKVDENKADSDNECCDYIKPSSPVKCNGVLPSNYTFNSNKTETPPRGTKLKLSRNVSWNQDSSSEKLSFTMRREFDKQKEETELIAQLRSIIETRLKMNLPEDIASALTDGVILCHLANYVRPRSVASIHVPSPGVPKLTMARCRRNVDNFLEACRKIGVDEELICSCADVVSNKETVEECLPNLKAVYRTISALLSLVHGHGPQHGQGDPSTSATNSNKTGQPEAEVDQSPSAQNGNGFNGTSFADNEVKSNDNRDETGLSTEFMEHFTAMCSSENGSVNIIFNTKEVCCCNNDFTDKTYYKPDIDLVDNGNYSNDEETKVTDRENFQRNEILIVNNLNAPKAHSQSFDYKNSSNLNINNEKNAPQKIVTKRIEFFERNTCGKANNDRSIFSIYNPSLDHQRKTSRGQDSLVLTIFLSSIFIITFLLLIIFPLPN